ncbi:hypothetical protein X975_27132, partial [Stegodyphus mimosarum]
MKETELGPQLDEATGSNKDANLIVCFPDDNIIVEDLLFCKIIIRNEKAQNFFIMLDKFITGNNLDWKKCICVCTEGF